MKLLRMTPGHGDVVLAEGDPEVDEDAERLIEEFRRQLDLGMWAAVPLRSGAGRHEATMVRDFSEVPVGTERVIFFPPAAGGGDRPRDAADPELRARELLRSVAGDGPADSYEQLGFVRVEGGGEGYGYLIYPHRPVVSYDADSREPLSELCVRFPDSGEWLPGADDVLAKWMALRADEHRLVGEANLHRVGVQLDPAMVARDLDRITEWEGAQ
jgi:hypothetical protein